MTEETREEVAYIYTRNGVEYYTPVEQVAASRTDTGTYQVVYGEVLPQGENISGEVK